MKEAHRWDTAALFESVMGVRTEIGADGCESTTMGRSLWGGKGQAVRGANKGFIYIHPNGVASEQITLANLPMTFKLRSIVGD